MAAFSLYGGVIKTISSGSNARLVVSFSSGGTSSKHYERKFIWFRKWVMERHVYKNLVRDSGMSQSSLQRLFKYYLSHVPPLTIRHKQQAHLLIDGTYFPGNICLILYWDHDVRFTQLYRLTDEERYQEIKEDLENIKSFAIEIVSITCDGHRAILKAIRKVLPHVIVQRCVVHVVRHCKTWLTQRPQSFAAVELLSIVNELHDVKTLYQSSAWLLSLWRWEKKYSSFITERVVKENGRYWYKHKMLRKSRHLLLKAIPNLFHYLDDPAIPRTTNRLESFFAHLKDKLQPHRGLTILNRKNFVKWYLYFQNQKSA